MSVRPELSREVAGEGSPHPAFGHPLPEGEGSEPQVALLTAGRDRPYALGLAAALLEKGIPFEYLGSDAVDSPFLHDNPLITFRNVRDQAENVSWTRKTLRVIVYYGRLLKYAVTARPRIFHILWNNKFEWFDRTLLMLFYRICGRKLVYTAHNVNAAARDGKDSSVNRLTLKIQYKLSHHIFVHTQQMSRELQSQFQVPARKVSVIPFGMNSTVPDTSLDRAAARQRLGLKPEDRVLVVLWEYCTLQGPRVFGRGYGAFVQRR